MLHLSVLSDLQRRNDLLSSMFLISDPSDHSRDIFSNGFLRVANGLINHVEAALQSSLLICNEGTHTKTVPYISDSMTSITSAMLPPGFIASDTAIVDAASLICKGGAQPPCSSVAICLSLAASSTNMELQAAPPALDLRRASAAFGDTANGVYWTTPTRPHGAHRPSSLPGPTWTPGLFTDASTAPTSSPSALWYSFLSSYRFTMSKARQHPCSATATASSSGGRDSPPRAATLHIVQDLSTPTNTIGVKSSLRTSCLFSLKNTLTLTLTIWQHLFHLLASSTTAPPTSNADTPAAPNDSTTIQVH